MKKNPVLLLLIVLVVLVGLAWMTGAFDAAPSTLSVPDTRFNVARVERIEITRPERALTLVRGATGWALEWPAAPADSVVVSRLLRGLADMRFESVVSHSPDRYTDFGVDDGSATQIRLSGEDFERKWTLASTGPGPSSAYARVNADERVLTASPRVFVPGGVDAWREKRILHIDPAGVARVDARTPDGEYALIREDDGWLMEHDGTTGTADSLAVVRLLRSYAPLRVDGFLDMPAGSFTSDPTHEITFRREGSSDIVLSMRPVENDLALVIADVPQVYRLQSSRSSLLIPEPSSLQ